jgi:uncharacterized protein (DUF58 family)
VKRAIRMRSWGLLLAVPILAVLQAVAPTPVVMMFLVMAVGLLVSSFLWVLELRGGVSVQRTRKHDWAQTGGILTEEFKVRSRCLLPVPWVEVSDENDLTGYDPRHVVSVGGQGEAQWTTSSRCTRRGVYSLGPTHLRMGDPFGLLEVTVLQQDTQPFYVYPALTTVPLLPRSRAALQGSVRVPRRSLTATTNVAGVRAYAPGDPYNHIHWRSTAHRSTPQQDELMIKEFEPEPLADFWIILDLDGNVHVGEEDVSTEEYGVRLAASLGYQMLQSRRTVGLIALGAEPIILQPQRGPAQLQHMLRALAGAHADGQMSLHQVLALHAPQIRSGAHCAVVTPSNDPQWAAALTHLASQAVHVTAMLLDDRPFGGLGDLRATVERLALLGVGSRVIGAELYAHLNPLPTSGGPGQPDQEPRGHDHPARKATLEWTSAIGGTAP